MPTRYSNRGKKINANSLYEEVFEKKDVKQILQYTTPTFPRLTAQMRRQLMTTQHIWKTGDSYQMLAEAFYGNPRYWWVLAWYNGKPTDALVKIGDTIRIPKPLQRVLEFFGV